MNPSSRYVVHSRDREHETITLARDGTSHYFRLDGNCVEAQFDLDSGEVLLILSDGSPYEAALHIYLLDKHDVVVGAIEGASPYASGIYKFIESGDDWLNFNFFTNDVVYRLGVFESPRLLFSLTTGWKYKNRLRKHHLTLTSFTSGN